jgi:deazaflavin-dependent oxidoreductase (nitroreductase family)
LAIWAANGGSPTHPNWYHNLKAHPKITVGVGTQTFTVLAEELDETARAELSPKLVAEWPKPVAGSPDLGAAQARTTRQFPVFMLTRQDRPTTRTRLAPPGTGAAGAGHRPTPATRPPNSAQAATGRGRRSSRGPATGTWPAPGNGPNAQLNRRQR